MKYVDVLRLFALAVPDATAATDYACEPKDETIEPVALRFTYHGKRFRLSFDSLFVEEVRSGLLVGSDAADALRSCLKAFERLETARAALAQEVAA